MTSFKRAKSVEEDHLRQIVTFSERRFDVRELAPDMRRVYCELKIKHDEEYALLFVFMMRTACELHRAWHMTLLTSKILQQIKDEFNLRMTWNLGVVKLIFRVDDGAHELHRKVPYDYDSEYQDIYMRIAIALIERKITIHEALIYQTETKKGMHTAKSGLFLRSYPGRLVLYPLEAATCAVIFFKGDIYDSLVAGLCGLVAGVIEMLMGKYAGEAKVLTDITVGASTGLIGGLFYHYSENYCLSAIFLGTLYWFFYGTAFVIGLLEIIAGELETGVTRFMAVAIKTFVLSLGAALGLMLATDSGASEAWVSSNAYCGSIDLSEKWWRIPLYLFCSATALGQYRLPIVQYWRGLTVQLAAYEVQYQMSKYLETRHPRDNLDTSASNIAGAAAGVITACVLSFIINKYYDFYHARLLQRDDEKTKNSRIGNCTFLFMKFWIKLTSCLRITRESEVRKLHLQKKVRTEVVELRDPSHPRSEIRLDRSNENLLIEAIVGSMDLNIWAILMPALYQLVPGSLIAKLWFESIFPPANADAENDVFGSLLVISISLALGLIVGFAAVQLIGAAFWKFCRCCFKSAADEDHARWLRQNERMEGMYSAPATQNDDPEANTVRLSDSEVEEFKMCSQKDASQSDDLESHAEVVEPVLSMSSEEVEMKFDDLTKKKEDEI